jgi:sulfate permease, SulP family
MKTWTAAGVRLMLARVRPPVRDLLDRSGVTEAIGAENIYNRVLEGVLVHLGTGDTDPKKLIGLSSDVLKRLQQVVGEMLVHTEGERQEQLEMLHSLLSGAIEQASGN